MIVSLPKLAERAVIALEGIAAALDRLVTMEEGSCGVRLSINPPTYCLRDRGHEGAHAWVRDNA